MNRPTKNASNSSLARFLTLSLGLSVAGLSVQSVRAADWVGDTSNDWNDPLNWSGDVFPNGIFAVINTGTTNVPLISATPTSGTPQDIFVGSASVSAVGRLDHTAGNAGTGAGNWFFVGENGGTGTYNLANTGTSGGLFTSYGQGSGSFTAGRLHIGNGQFHEVGTSIGTVNINTSGTMNLTGGANSGVNVGLTLGYDVGSTGTLNLDNGTVNGTGETWVGGDGNGTLNQSGGTLNSTGYLVIGRGGGSVSSYNLTGGTVNAATGFGLTSVGSAATSSGTLAVSGSGVFNSNAGMFVGEGWTGSGTATGTVNISGGGLVSTSTNGVQMGVAAIGNGTVNLNGGTLQTGQVSKGTGVGVINFNGGTLKATRNNTTFLTGMTSANVLAGGAVIDSNGFDVTIGQALSSGTTGDGGLTKNGAGALTLTGTHTYTGATTVNGGTLRVNGALDASSAVSVVNGALAGSGTAGAVTVTGTGGIISNGTGAGNTTALKIGSLTFGTTGSFSLNKANDTSTVALSIAGALTTVPGVVLNVTTAPAWVNGSTYNLIGYGSLSGTNPSLGMIAGLGARQAAVVGNTGATNGFITLAISGDTPYWTGSASNAWTTGTVPSPKNWKLLTAGTPTDFLNNDQVLFNDNGANTSVDITGTNVGVASVTFNNNTKNYTIGSNGGFGIVDGSGPAAVLKSGTGKVTLTSSNGYTGGTFINAGTVAINNAASLGAASGAVTIGNNATLETLNSITASRNFLLSGTAGIVTTSGTYQVDGTLNDDGAMVGTLVKGGTGTLVLTAANGYTGGTTINSGTLQLTTTSGTASNATFNLNGGAFQVNLGAAANFNYAPTINVTASNSRFGNAAAGSVSNFNGQINYTGTLNGNGNPLNIANTGLARIYMNGMVSNVSQINILSGAMGFDLNVGNRGGDAAVNVSNGAALWIAGATNQVANSITLNGGSGINGLGALYQEGGGAPLIQGLVTLNGATTIGGNDAAGNVTLFSGVTGTGPLTKAGANKYTISSPSNYTGSTTIAGGALLANDGAALSSGTVSISGTLGTQLQLGSGVDMANSLVINGGAITGQGALHVPSGSATYSGNISITGTTQAGGHFGSVDGVLTVSGSISSSVPVSIRSGTVLLTNTASSYSALDVRGGTARLGATNVIPTSATVSMGASAASTLDLAGFNQMLVGLTNGAQSSTVTNSGAVDSTLTTTGTSTFGGVIQDGVTNKTLLTVNNGSSLTLTGASTFTGDVNINGTVFANRSNNTLNPTSSALGNPQAAHNITVNNGGLLNFVLGDTLGSADTTVVSTLVINQGGTVTNTGGNFNTFGAVQLNGGTLTGVGGAVPGYQMYNLRGTVTVGGTAASTISGTGSNAGYHLAAPTTFDVADVAGGSDLNVSGILIDQDNTHTGAGALTKNGLGTMTLSGSNTYTGATTVNGGTLSVSAGGALNGTSTSVGTGAAFVLQDNARYTFDIGASGINDSLTGTGTVTLDGDFFFNLALAGTGIGDSWNVVDVTNLTESFGSFTVANPGASENNNVWTFQNNSVDYQFSETTGMLTVVPEPSTVVMLLGGAGFLGFWRRARRHSV